jgi:hypothetical protein
VLQAHDSCHQVAAHPGWPRALVRPSQTWFALEVILPIACSPRSSGAEKCPAGTNAKPAVSIGRDNAILVHIHAGAFWLAGSPSPRAPLNNGVAGGRIYKVCGRVYTLDYAAVLSSPRL